MNNTEQLQVCECAVCGKQAVMDMGWNGDRHSNTCEGNLIQIGWYIPLSLVPEEKLTSFIDNGVGIGDD